MNLLLTTSTFPRWRDDDVPDFVWRQVLAFKRQFPEMRIHVLAPHDAGAAARETWEGIHIHRFRYFYPRALQRLVYPAIWPNIKRNPLLLALAPCLLVSEFLATIKLIRRENISLVYSHWFMPQGVACGLAAWALRVPHVLTSHSSDVQVMSKLPVLGPGLVRFLLRRCHAITAVSHRSLEKIKRYFSGASWDAVAAQTKIIPMGVELQEWRMDGVSVNRAAEQRGLANKTVLLSIGRLVEKKGLQFLLRALDHPTVKSRNDFVLIIAGSGPLRETLEREVNDRNLQKHVQFVGFVKGEQKREWFALSSILLIPSIITDDGDAEGFPVSLMEGLSTGKVCIATDVSGADEVLRDGENGYLVPEKSVESLRRTLLLALDKAPEERRRMGDNARRCAARFDMDKIAREHYEHLIAPIVSA